MAYQHNLMTKLEELRSDIITHHDQVRRIQMEIEEYRGQVKGHASQKDMLKLSGAASDLMNATRSMESAQRLLAKIKATEAVDIRDYDAELKDNQLDDKYGY